MSTKQMSGSAATLKSLMTIDGEGGWIFVSDSFGDYRGINEALGQRTRLKRSLEWAKHDVTIGRLQTRIAGEWVDRIDGGRR